MSDSIIENGNASRGFSLRNFFNRLTTDGKENTSELSPKGLLDLSRRYSENAYQTVGWAGLSTWATIVSAAATVVTRDPMMFAATMTFGGSALAEGALANRRQDLAERFNKMAQKLARSLYV